VVTVGDLGSLLDAGHLDEDHAHLAAVVVFARLLQARGLEPVSLIGDHESGVQGLPCAVPWARGPAARLCG
jgi:hypothetical protein